MNDWIRLVEKAVKKLNTPFYLFDERKIYDSISFLKTVENSSVKHWFSFKTTPIKKFIETTTGAGFGIEVVSEYELLAALNCNIPPEKILINGVNKHIWLNQCTIKNLNVNFDSVTEVHTLIKKGKELNWEMGLRFHPSIELDPDENQYSTQFGMSSEEIKKALRIFSENNVSLKTIHFHIGTQVIDDKKFENTINETIILCKKLNLEPINFDCGGGFPFEYKEKLNSFSLINISKFIDKIKDELNSVKNVWFENGRIISAGSAVLVTKINDIKFRDGMRFLICDGGRTNNALVSDWEKHNYMIFPKRESDNSILSTVCGPTCMSYDHFIRENLPSSIQIGDFFIWMDAGAYHIPWETRFSGGLASVIWYRDDQFEIIRNKENFESWWSIWI